MAACVRVAVQRAVRAAATLGWWMAGAWRALARAKLLRKAAASSLHLPPNLEHHQAAAALVVEEFWVGSFFASAGVLQRGSCEPSCSASGLAFSSEW